MIGTQKASRGQLKDAAIAKLDGKWGKGALLTLVYMLIVVALLPKATFIDVGLSSYTIFGGSIFTILIVPVLEYGYVAMYLNFKEDGLSFNKMFEGFKKYGKTLGTTLLTALYILLWTFLLIIPGIVKGYSYAMVPYILKENPNLSANKIINQSRVMMYGNKWRLFVLDLSFLAWVLLCLLTAGIGFLWLTPYVAATRAEFYMNLKEEIKQEPIQV